MSGDVIRAEGQAGLDERAREEEAIRLQRRQDNKERTTRTFWHDFFRDHYRYDQKERRYVVRDDNPIPPVEGWTPDERGMYFADVGKAPSTFICDGIRFRCRWEYKGLGGDPAWWDDGWWPQWYVVVQRRRRWLPFLWRDVDEEVYGLAAVADVLNQPGTRAAR